MYNSTYDKYHDYVRYGFQQMGFTTGQPSLDFALMMLTGQAIQPRPAHGTPQSIFDAYAHKERNLQFGAARNMAFANNMFAQRLGGLDPNNFAVQMGAGFLGDPNGPIMKMASPFMGGNPIKAQMGLFGHLSGQTMGTFGQIGNVTVPQTTDMMNQLYKNFYKDEKVTSGMVNERRNDAIALARKLSKNHPDLMSQFTNALGSEDEANSFRTEITSARQAHKLASEGGDDIKDKIDKFIEGLTDTRAKEKITKAWAEANGDAAKFAKSTDKMGQHGPELISALDDYFNIKKMEGQMMPAGIKFSNTRGFRLEDITEAFVGAADFRLLGKRDLSTNFERAVGENDGRLASVLDAGRGLFGNDKSGAELISSISDLVGKDFYDLADKNSAAELEDLLYSVKSAARTAGITVDAIMGIIKEGQAFAASHPDLKYLGGGDIAKMAIRSTNMATAYGAFMGGEYVRQQGGLPGLTQQIMAGEMQARTEPISQQLGALYEMFDVSGNTSATNFIEKYATTPGAGHTRVGFNNFVNRLASLTGQDVFHLRAFAQTSKGAAQQGLAKAPQLGNAAFYSAEDELRNMVNRHTRVVDSFTGVTNKDLVENMFAGQTIDMDKLMADGYSGHDSITKRLMGMARNGSEEQKSGAMKRLSILLTTQARSGKVKGLSSYLMHDPDVNPNEVFGRANIAGEAVDTWKQYVNQAGYLKHVFASKSPFMKSYLKSVEEKSATDKKMDEELSSALGVLHAPMTTQIFDKFMNGDIDREGLGAIMDVFKNRLGKTDAEKMTALKDRMIDLNNSHDEGGILTAMKALGVGQLADVDLLKTMTNAGQNAGLTAEDLRTHGKSEASWKRFIAGKSGMPKFEDAQRMQQALGKVDPNGLMKGTISVENMREGLQKGLVQNFTEYAIKPDLDRNQQQYNNFWNKVSKGFDGSTDGQRTGAGANAAFDLAKDLFYSKTGNKDREFDLQAQAATMGSKEFNEALEKRVRSSDPAARIDRRGASLAQHEVTRAATRENELKTLVTKSEQDSANREMGKNIQKLTDTLVGKGGIVDMNGVLSELKTTLRNLMTGSGA